MVVSGFPLKVVPVDFWKSYERLAARLRSGETRVTYYERFVADAFPTDVARNQIVRYMLAKDFDALLFLDADHVFEQDLFERLASHGKDVITARYHVKRPPFHANAFVQYHSAKPGFFKTVHYGKGCFQIDRGGAGALLISRRVLEAIGEDWFRYQRNPNPDEPADFSVSEDFWFYQRAQECGFSCWVDWETEARHLATVDIGKEQHDVYLRAMEQQLTPELAAELIVCGYDAPLEVAPGFRIAPYQPTSWQTPEFV